MTARVHPVFAPPLPIPTDRPLVLYLPGVGGTARGARWTGSVRIATVVTAARRPVIDPRNEPSLRARAHSIAESLVANGMPDRVVVIGHSLGAVVGFEVARALERWRSGAVERLVVTGQVAPHHLPRTGPAGLTGAAVLRRMTGADAPPVELAGAPEAVQALVPQWQAEYGALDRYECAADPEFSADVEVWTGHQDQSTADDDAVRAWARCTAGTTAFRRFEGGHDFLNHDLGATARAISALLDEVQGREPKEQT